MFFFRKRTHVASYGWRLECMRVETHRHSSYRLTVADIGTEKSRTLVTCSLHELHCFVSTHRSHRLDRWRLQRINEKGYSVSKQRKTIDWSGHFVIFFFSEKLLRWRHYVFKHANTFFPSKFKLQRSACSMHSQHKCKSTMCDTSIELLWQTYDQSFVKPDHLNCQEAPSKHGHNPPANWTPYSCAKVCMDYGSPRMARARFDARTNLTELIAWLGRWLLEKSGRSLAIDSSCSLLSNNVVSATFIRGLSLLLSSSTWTKWRQSYRIDLVLWPGYNWYRHPNFLSQHRNNKLPSHVEGVARNVAVWMGFS